MISEGGLLHAGPAERRVEVLPEIAAISQAGQLIGRRDPGEFLDPMLRR
ncbi:MAG: hypothetical protein U0790_16245 [Isosphaeraceae bacterium]